MDAIREDRNIKTLIHDITHKFSEECRMSLTSRRSRRSKEWPTQTSRYGGAQSIARYVVETLDIKHYQISLQVVHYVTGTLSAPGRTLITLSLDAYVQSADTLRQLADVTASDRRTRFDVDKKRETLRQLRGQFENGRKLFNFALVNASTYSHDN